MFSLTLTHVGFVLEGVVTRVPAAVEVGRTLAVEVAAGSAAVLRRPEPLESLHYDGGGLPVIVGVHLHV